VAGAKFGLVLQQLRTRYQKSIIEGSNVTGYGSSPRTMLGGGGWERKDRSGRKGSRG